MDKFELAPMYDDDDVEFMFEAVLDTEGRKSYVELYVEKVTIGLSGSVGGSGEFSSASSSRSLYMTRVDSDGNSRGSSVYRDEDIPFYRSFDGATMFASFDEPILQKVGNILNPSELGVGMVFETKEELLNVVKDVHIINHLEMKVVRSNSERLKVECRRKESGCVWMLRATKKKSHNHFEIMETNGPHTCVNPNMRQDHYNLNSSNIAQVIGTQIAADPGVADKVLEVTVVSQFGYRPSRRKIRHAREKLEKNLFKSSEESYEYLPFFMNALQSFNHGTYVDWHFKEHDLAEPINEVVRFKRVFWAFKPCIDAFAHSLPVLLIDGTHLYDKYGGVLLTATTVDGFNHLIPVAFAIVEAENIASWSWFMDIVKKKVVLRRIDVCVISDRHAGIISAMNNPDLGWREPQDHHRYCARHLAANFGKEFKNNLKERVVPLCSQLTVHKFNLHWKSLLSTEPRAEQWFSDKPLKHWVLAFDDGRRFGIMTTNFAECWNNAIRAARKLPITALVKSIFYKVVEYFDQRRLEIEKQHGLGNEFTKYATKILNKWKERASGHHVKVFDHDNWLFEVTTMKRGQKGGNQQIVRLMERICTCNKWQTYQIPCSHVLACCANQKIQYTTLVSEWYRLDNARKVYATLFEPLPHEDRWPLFDRFPKVLPDDENFINKPGRRKSIRDS
ncbi:uncharacterized protein LOC141664975 [Apium graveolens]|uniref:uncharacterized protein LOC141664975 n=1 Tax=Apium graveolens TaxID=4045 RepID=UPI003D7AB386